MNQELSEWLINYKIIPNKKIKLLFLSDQQLNSLPNSIEELKELYFLNLSNNQLTTIPETIGELKELETLWLSNNQLLKIPETISKLTKLKRLRLDDNNLTTIPETIGELKELEYLSLSNNQLTNLDEAICRLPNLEYLTVSGNNFIRAGNYHILNDSYVIEGWLINLDDYLISTSINVCKEKMIKEINKTIRNEIINHLINLDEIPEQLQYMPELTTSLLKKITGKEYKKGIDPREIIINELTNNDNKEITKLVYKLAITQKNKKMIFYLDKIIEQTNNELIKRLYKTITKEYEIPTKNGYKIIL